MDNRDRAFRIGQAPGHSMRRMMKPTPTPLLHDGPAGICDFDDEYVWWESGSAGRTDGVHPAVMAAGLRKVSGLWTSSSSNVEPGTEHTLSTQSLPEDQGQIPRPVATAASVSRQITEENHAGDGPIDTQTL